MLTRRQLVLVEKVHDYLEDDDLQTLFKRREEIDDEMKATTLKQIQLDDELEELDEELIRVTESLWKTISPDIRRKL